MLGKKRTVYFNLSQKVLSQYVSIYIEKMFMCFGVVRKKFVIFFIKVE